MAINYRRLTAQALNQARQIEATAKERERLSSDDEDDDDSPAARERFARDVAKALDVMFGSGGL